MPQAGGREEGKGLTKSERVLATISPMDLLFTLCSALKQPTGDGGGTDEQTDCCRRRCPNVTSQLFLEYPFFALHSPSCRCVAGNDSPDTIIQCLITKAVKRWQKPSF